MSGYFQDFRSFVRFAVSIPSKFLHLDSSQECEGEIRDISPIGIRLLTEEDLPLHSNIELRLQVPGVKEELYTRGYIAWSHKNGCNKYYVGVVLENIDLVGISRILRAVEHRQA